MKGLLAWWYRISLPRHLPETTPIERERMRYTRLTSIFTLVVLVVRMVMTPLVLLKHISPMNQVVTLTGFGLILATIVVNKWGFNIGAAIMVVGSTIGGLVGALLAVPLDPGLVPVLGSLLLTVILAGSLMPPVAALITGVLNSAIIVLMMTYQPHTAAYAHMMQANTYGAVLALMMVTEIGGAVIIYVILNSLMTTLRRADRAEQIIALQKAIAEHEHERLEEQKQLEEGLAMLAQVHTAIASGNLDVRVPVGANSVLRHVGVPLNNLLSKVRRWKGNADQLEKTLAVMDSLVRTLQRARAQNRPVFFQQPTGTLLDPLLPELNYLSEQRAKATRFFSRE